jgi:pimeloyl-ACP methyl ester carboxylesterase
MSADTELNERGNHQGQFAQGVGGWAEYTVHMTETFDTIRHDVTVPPGKVIPVIFLPGVMGSNLRMSKKRQKKLDLADNRAWKPDDLRSLSGETDVARGVGMGGWFRNASPAQRQLIFDPNETEVEYYHYTENKGRFDPDGTETLAADARHQNVPDSLSAIPPLMSNRSSRPAGAGNGRGVVQRKLESPAQIARWRGWSEVLFSGAYGHMLKTAETFLNNIVVKGKIHPLWQSSPTAQSLGSTRLPMPYQTITDLLREDPRAFGASTGSAITESDLRKIALCWYPVHAMGYNFLKSNGESAVVIAERIRGLVKGYQQRGFKCDEVIIVTHSMGGLVARALLHPRYGDILNDKTVKVLGMYHNVMPTMGAASAYKRMRFGFQEKEGYAAELEASVLAIDGRNATAILANAPAPLEMMPGEAYGQDWLKLVDGLGRTLWSWPRNQQSALDSIYLQPDKAWWRLINPQWVNPGNVLADDGGGLEHVYKRLKDAAKFTQAIKKTFHPTGCYASYCASANHQSYGDVVFKIIDSEIRDTSRVDLPPPETWQLLTDNGKNTLTVRAGHRVLTLKLQPPSSAGDETVPSDRSARQIDGTLFVHGEAKGHGYEHQSSYSDPQVLASMLYSIVQIAKTAKWG